MASCMTADGAGGGAVMPQLAVEVDFLSEFSRLQTPVQKRTKEALAKFQEHTHAGLHLEKLAGVRDDRVRTIRIDKFWRGVVLAPDTGDRYLLLRVMGHDDAITWAKSHKFSVNEVSGVLEIRDVAALDELAAQLEAPVAAALLFREIKDSELRRLGVDEQVLLLARSLADVAHLDLVAPFLPENQSEVLYGLASGMSVDEVWSDVVAPRVPSEPIDIGDLAAAAERTQGRIALVDGPEELLALFDKPMALWRVFLHPSQEKVAYRASYWGSAQVTGGPGTGKTVVALHRVKHLISSRDLAPKSILLTTYTRGLAAALERDLAQLLEPAERQAVQVMNIDRWAHSLVRDEHGTIEILTDADERRRWERAATETGTPFTPAFLGAEWRHVVLAQQILDEDDYLRAQRRGRGRGLGPAQKRRAWEAITHFVDGLRADHKWTWLMIADEAARLVSARDRPPFRHVVVDEVQDLHPAQWRLLRAATSLGPDDLFLTGDPHQRIYGNHVSLRQVGIHVGGRSTRLKINYRTSAEILAWALRVLGSEGATDFDDGVDTLTGYRSALHGEAPTLAGAPTPADEGAELVAALNGWREAGVEWSDIAVVARTNIIAKRMRVTLEGAGIEVDDLHALSGSPDAVRIGTMHGMKGLEFRCVAIVGANADQLPLPVAVTDEGEDAVRHRLDVQQERCLLFVACTRARERLRVSWSGHPSVLVKVTPTPS